MGPGRPRSVVDALVSIGRAGCPPCGSTATTLYWLESQPSQGGRTGLWRQPLAGGPASRADSGARQRPHPGATSTAAASTPSATGLVVYSELRRRPGLPGAPRPGPSRSRPAGAFRYGDLRLHPDQGLVLAVREDHSGDGEPVHTIVRLDLAGPNLDGGTVLCAGADFYATPELSADGRLAWTEWNHPDMPWDASTVMVGDLGDGRGERAEGGRRRARASRRCSRAGSGERADPPVRPDRLVEPLPGGRTPTWCRCTPRMPSSASRSGRSARRRTRCWTTTT